MAKKKSEPRELHSMSLEELRARLAEFQESQFRLRFRHATNPLKNPMQIRAARREIARIRTVLREKHGRAS